MRQVIPSLVSLSLLGLAGCPDRSIDKVTPSQDKIESKDIPVNIDRDIDILFLIDKSPTMGDEQAALTANFPRFIQSLSLIEGGLPNVHIGVISQDIGAGNMTVGGTCSGLGDNGNLLATARPGGPPGCMPPNGNFISDIDTGGGNRQRNYTGTLEDTFACIATLGPTGCGFEQHLGSLEKALESAKNGGANAGFLRPDAFLAIVIISDEDDCSAKDPQLYNPSNSAVGPLADFRCFEWGWECDEGVMSRTAPGSYTNCRPRMDSPFIHHPDKFVQSIKAIKTDPKKIIVSLINGPSANTDPAVPTTSVTINTAMNNVAQLQPSCQLGNQNAFPMPRLHYFAQQFPDRNSFFSLCNDDDGNGQADLDRAMDLIAQLIKRVVGNPCFEANVSTVDLDPNNPGQQLDCVVEERSNDGTPAVMSSLMPTCAMQDATTPAANAVQPCWYVKPNPVQCAEYPSKLVFAVHPEQRNTPPDTHLLVQCVVGQEMGM